MGTIYKKNRAKSFLQNNENGFTLLEVLIATTILSVGLLAMGSAESISVANSYTARNVSVATVASEEIFERMRRNRSNILSYNGFDTSQLSTRPTTSGTLQNDYDQWKVNVERVIGACASVIVTVDSPVLSVSTASVTLMWPPCDGSTRQVTVQTLY